MALMAQPGNDRDSLPVTVNPNLDNPYVLASLIDHTLLKPEATETDIARVCEEAREHGFATVCVNPYWVPFCASNLSGSGVKVCAVIGFPLGANAHEVKRAELDAALRDGALEVDMVQNVGALRSGKMAAVDREIQDLAETAHRHNAILKVIIETCLLTEEEIAWSCRIAARAGADFVKTSTGFSSAGASAANVRLMRKTVGGNIGVKASGGIRTLADLIGMVEAGANRIGASSGVKILAELAGKHAA